jgi:hypothetical protein
MRRRRQYSLGSTVTVQGVRKLLLRNLSFKLKFTAVHVTRSAGRISQLATSSGWRQLEEGLYLSGELYGAVTAACTRQSLGLPARVGLSAAAGLLADLHAVFSPTGSMHLIRSSSACSTQSTAWSSQ